MAVFRALLLAETDNRHFGDAAFNGAAEGRVGLYAVDDNDGVRLKQMGRHPDGIAVFGVADVGDLHGGKDRRTHGGLVDAEGIQNFRLSLRCGAAVASHGRHDEGVGLPLLHNVHQLLHHHGEVGDLPASHGDHHRLPGLMVP